MARSRSRSGRLFRCECTAALRGQYLKPDDIDFIRYSADIRALIQGVQIMPDPAGPRSTGLGHQNATSWTLSGGPIEDLLVGDVFTDGSCFRHGPPTWTQTGWSVCKVSSDGVLLGYLCGSVGTQLPQPAPAAEYVAGLALATSASSPTVSMADYKGLAGLESAPQDSISYRKSIYSGLKLQIRGRAPAGSKFIKVPGHVSLEDCTTPDSRCRQPVR